MQFAKDNHERQVPDTYFLLAAKASFLVKAFEYGSLVFTQGCCDGIAEIQCPFFKPAQSCVR